MSAPTAPGRRRPVTETFATPALLGASTAFGLVLALVGDGASDAIACLALALPLVSILKAVRKAA